ncbi:uncharacterized protein EV420DRAFT_1650133 [Desarmillaria tabescens]|uniref:Uncharacterized protein n=1 Tax=Armillaria tabescens TaxID=1929756 RepID=A0AA39MP84_ARMTA|nr:uncharacterized protein EV420DRAFT_1650133 [Desarmillaria tabescens]KAK0441213.1 hypothetical protein EV420DRAFT_1650133 [Desarmillaria tabescens]
MDSDFSDFTHHLPLHSLTNQELSHSDYSLTALLHSDDYDLHSLGYSDPTLGFNLPQLPSHASLTSTLNDQCSLPQAENSNLSLGFPIGGGIIDSSFSTINTNFYATRHAEDLNGWEIRSTAAHDNTSMIGNFNDPGPSISRPICPRDPVQVPASKFIAYDPAKEKSTTRGDTGKHSNKPVAPLWNTRLVRSISNEIGALIPWIPLYYFI